MNLLFVFLAHFIEIKNGISKMMRKINRHWFSVIKMFITFAARNKILLRLKK